MAQMVWDTRTLIASGQIGSYSYPNSNYYTFRLWGTATLSGRTASLKIEYTAQPNGSHYSQYSGPYEELKVDGTRQSYVQWSAMIGDDERTLAEYTKTGITADGYGNFASTSVEGIWTRNGTTGTAPKDLTISGTATLPAISALTYSVSYNANGGSGTVASQTKTHGTNLTLQSGGYSRSGYTLSKWTLNSTSGTEYNLGGTYSTNAAATFYAKWTQNTYTVSYNANGGSGTVANQTKYGGTALTLASSGYTKNGYTLAGWNAGSTSGTAYSLGGSYTTEASTTMYARWTENTYTVSYNANGGSGTVASQTKYGGSNLTLRSSGYTLAGYQLAGWNAGSTQGTPYSLGGTYSTNAATTMYARWTGNTYYVRFNANGGSGTMSNETFTYGQSKALTSNAFTRDGYSFYGWATSSTGARAYTNGQSVSNLTTTNGGTVDLYAVWTANSYTVKYNSNGGSGTIADGTKTGGQALTLPSSGFTKTGYHMSAWTLNSTSGTQYALGGSYTTNAAATFYAKWAANTYKVKFNANGGSGTMADESFTYDQPKALTSNAFTRTGYEFKGWATSSGGAVVYGDGQSVSNLTTTDNGTVNLYAVWSVIGVEVKVNGNWVYGQVYVKRNGNWVIGQVFVKHNGTWKEGQ